MLRPGGRFLAVERRTPPGAPGLASHGWTTTRPRRSRRRAPPSASPTSASSTTRPTGAALSVSSPHAETTRISGWQRRENSGSSKPASRSADAIAAYHEAGDRYRLEELAACFTPRGVLEIKGDEPVVGRAAIVALLGHRVDGPRSAGADGAAKFYVRHHVSSVRFASVTPDEAHTTAYFLVMTPIGVDHWGRYRDTFVPVDDRWLFAHRFVAVARNETGSYFGPRITD